MIYANHELKAAYIHIPKCGGCYIRDLLINHYGFKNALPHKKKTVLSHFFENPDHYSNSDGTVTTIRTRGLVRYFQTPYSETDIYDEFQHSEKRVVNNIVWHMVNAVCIQYDASGDLSVNQDIGEVPNELVDKILTEQTKEDDEVAHENKLKQELKTHSLNSIYNKIVKTHLAKIKENEKNQHTHLTNEQFSEYYKFTFVRCPYTKLVSAYTYCKKMRFIDCYPEHYTDFNDFVNFRRDKIGNQSWFHSYIKQFDHLVDFSGNINMNYIGRVETIDNDLLCVLKQLGIGEIKHWDNIQNNRILNQSKMDRPFYEYYDEASFQFVNEWFVQDFKTFQIKRFHTLEAMQSYYKTHPLNVNRPTELYKQMQLNQLYNCGKLKESIQTLETEYANYFENIKLFYGIKDDDYHFNHGKTIMLEIIRDSQTRVKKIMALPQFEGVIKYIEATNDDFKRKRKKCKLCGNHASQNLLAHIAHSNICKELHHNPPPPSNPLNR
jgi:hypothetical protein